MPSTLTPSAEAAVIAGEALAAEQGVAHAGALHLLFGLAMVSDSFSSRALEDAGVTPAAIGSVASQGAGSLASDAIKAAEELAANAGHALVGTEHLFFAVSDDSRVAQLLRAHDVPIGDLRNTVLGGAVG